MIFWIIDCLCWECVRVFSCRLLEMKGEGLVEEFFEILLLRAVVRNVVDTNHERRTDRFRPRLLHVVSGTVSIILMHSCLRYSS